MQRALGVLFLLSGIPALGYQLAWTRMFAVGLGHEMSALLAVVAAFFGGLALGALVLDRPISRSARPGAWYAALELANGTWALLTPYLIEHANGLVANVAGAAPGALRYWCLAFAIPFVTLLPATFAMGATLVAADRWLRAASRDGATLARVYALNTTGAACGVVAASALLMPLTGLGDSVRLLAALNLLVAVVAWRCSVHALPTLVPTALAHPPRAVGAALATCGFLGIAYEVLTVRAMAQVFEGTVYSFAAALLVYLLGTAAGAAVFERRLRAWPPRAREPRLIVAVATACVAGLGVLFVAADVYRSLRRLLGDSILAVTTAEGLMAAGVLLPATAAMGALFCHFAERARHAHGGIGAALGLNTAGGLLAPPVAGLYLQPTFGAKWSILLVAWSYLLLLPRPWTLPRWLPLLPLAGALALPPALRIVTLRDGERVIDYREGTLATVAVTTRPGERNLRINNRFQMGGTSRQAARIQRMQAHLPLLLHPAPRAALFLGVASGITAGAALAHPGLRVDAVELVPESLAMLGHFATHNGGLANSPRVTLTSADARRFVRASTATYDVIVGDLFHPARDGAALLYSVEHFRAVRGRLRRGGLYCQWLPLYQMDAGMLRMTMRSFAAAFRHVEAWLATFDLEYPALALCGSTAPPRLDLEQLEARLAASASLREQLAEAAVREPHQLLAHFLAGPAELARWSGAGALNSDDHPRLLFAAPAFTYARGHPPQRTLRALHGGLRALRTAPGVPPGAGAVDRRIHALLRARDTYLDALLLGADDAPTARVEGVIAAARQSADFTLAYAYAANFALQRARSDPGSARRWLEALRDARPERPLARRLLRRLAPAE
ncbi:MAG: spermidine synthase [Gammaproteobacteria bacterium]